uniref:Reverse transcriptase domain-containing protein n=1 Tax=Tanacetum cinerariifolium TaxID=118510 RepID=A0A699GXE9_TANCI|nr:reverse transcriptase domain-containing protein [Tanacetum cinerariifolium]
MQTRSSSKFSRDQTSNPTSSTNTTPKGRIRKSSKQKVENSNFEEHLHLIATMADNRTMAEMLRAPTEGCAEVIVIPPILAEQFELKHSLIDMMTLEQFFRLEKDNSHDHIRAARRWLEKEPPRGNLLEKSPQDALTIIENKSKVRNSRSKPIASQVKACDVNSSSEIAKLTHAVNQQISVVTTVMTAMLKQFQATPPPAPVKAVEEICVTCGGFNRGNNFNKEQSYQATAQPNQNFHLNELEKIKRMNEVSMKAMQNQIDMVKNKLRNEMKTSIQTSLSNQTNEIKNMMAILLQMNTPSTSWSGSLPSNTVANPKGKLKAITTRSGLATNRPTVLTPPKSVTLEVGECVEETYTDPDLTEYTIKVPPPPKELGLPELIPTRMTLELANRAICTPAGIARDVFIPVGKFTFPADFVVVDYESDPRVPLILGRPFLRTTRALIDVYGQEMILRDGDERLTLNMKHDTASYSNHPQRESVNLINIFNVSSEDFLEKFPDIDSINDIHPYFDDNLLSGSTTYFSNSLLEEFTDELALITYPPDYDDNLQFDIESDLKEIEFLLYQGKDSSHKDLIDQTDLANIDDYFVDPTPEMFTDEHAPDYSSPPIFDVYDDDFLEVESDADNVYDDPFDSKEEKIKEVDALPSTNNEGNVFNPGILIHETPVKIITRVAQDKKLARSNASLVLEDFDPPFYEPLFFKDIPKSKMLLLFSSENEEKFLNQGYTLLKRFILVLSLDYLIKAIQFSKSTRFS